MKALVIGGHGRDIGKTRLAELLLRRLRPFRWTAVKISAHGHAGAGPFSGATAGTLGGHAFSLYYEEREPSARRDTARYLAAGARRALWLSVGPGRLAEALPALRAALAGEQHVLFESGRILEFLRPSLFLFVLNPAGREFKPSARRRLKLADAFVVMEGKLDEAAWPGVARGLLRRKPMFTVKQRRVPSELGRFVLRRLARAPEARFL
jgi:hypothetical protein